METRIRVAGLVIQDDHLLLVTTKKGAPGFWVPPGGGVEQDEAIGEAVEREILEEADLRVQAGKLIGYREVFRTDRLELELYLLAQPSVDQPCTDGVSTEDRGLRWVPLAELSQIPHFPDKLTEMVQHALRGIDGAFYLGAARL